MKVRVYLYDKCGACRNAVKFLRSHGLEFESVPIREQPPSRHELKQMLAVCGGNLRKLFNTSGQDYRRLKLGERLSSLSEDEALKLLASNGNLVKRPFVLTAKGGLVGFNETEWRRLLGE